MSEHDGRPVSERDARPVSERDLADVLVGRWELTGRSRDADHDDISGAMTAVPVGSLLQITGHMRVGDTRIESVEIIWKHQDRPGWGAHVYPAEGEPLVYHWDLDGDTLIHAGLGMTYLGAISPDGATIEGDWLPDPDRPDMAVMAYHAVMRRAG